MSWMFNKSVAIFLVIFSVVSIALGTYHQKMLFFGDTDLTYHFGKNFFSFGKVYLWNDYFKAGIFDFDKLQAFYLKKVIFMMNSATSLYFFSYLWYFLPIFCYITSFYFLIREIQKFFSREVKPTISGALPISLFSAINGIFVLYYGQALVIISLILVNLFLILFIKNISYLESQGKNNYKLIVLGGLILSQVNIYLHSAFLLLYAGIIIALINYRFILRYWREFLAQLFILIVLALLLNAQWLIPVFSQAFLESGSVKNLIIYDSQLGWEQAKSISKNIFISDLLKIKSYHVFENHPSYFNLFYFLPIGIILFFLAKRKEGFDSYLQKILIFLIISLFFSYGIKPVSESLYLFLWSHLPLFTAFRTIFKFSFLYLYAIVFLLAYILVTMKKGREYIIVSFLLILNIIFSMHYYFQPEVARTLQQYEIPEYYFSLQAANLAGLNNKLGNNISSPQFNWQFQYEWAPEKVDGMNILPYFYGSGFFINGAQDSPDVQYIYNDYFDYNLRNGSLDTVKNLLSMRNIKFITYQDDLRVTDNESTPYIVKSNLEAKPLYEKVFSKRATAELCSDLIAFGKLTLCRVKNSLFSPLFQTKDVRPIVIKDGSYLSDLKGASYFIPYNKRSEKGHQQVNLVEENPVIVSDLIQMGITNADDIRLFETKTQGAPDSFSPKKLVYPSFKPFEVKNCYFQLGCSLFFFQNIEPGRYSIYFVRHVFPGEAVENKEYSLVVSDKVSDEFIANNVKSLYSGEKILDYPLKETSQSFSFVSQRMNKIGETDLVGSNILIRTLTDNFFSNGAFYLVREGTDSSTKPSAHIEFKKINPTKFRVRIHNASGPFSLIFSENFDKNWYVYRASSLSQPITPDTLEKYVLLRGNETDQATKKELWDFVKGGLVTDFGNLSEKVREHKVWEDNQAVVEKREKYRIGFISKDIDSVIQNDNLPEGKLWETWFRKPFLANRSHFEDDGYSNGWVIDPQFLCEQNNKDCQKNADGTIDFELVIEFWPQRMLYAGLTVSLITFVACIAFLFWRKRQLIPKSEL